MIKHFCSLFLIILFSAGAVGQGTTSLSGVITTAFKKNVPGATITLLNTERTTFSDSAGKFIFTNISAGRYTLVVSSIGYATLSEEIVVIRNTVNEVVIFLLPTAGYLDEVVVTAQKKEELLQKIPISITALSARQVKEYRVWRSNELTGIVPNLYSAHSGDDRNVTSIRGITTTSYDPAVATYIDGVNQFGLDTYIANLVDVERIEILRGPQGSLYGRNAMGGVINIITKQPTNRTTGFSELNLGNFNQLRFTGGVRSPILKNKLYAGISMVYQQRDGFYKNTFTNTSYDKQYSVTGNYYLKYIPAPRWSVVMNVKHHNNRNNGAFPLVFGVADAFANPFELSQNAVARMIDNTFNSSLSVNHTGSFFNFSSQTAYQSNQRFYNAPLDGDFSPIDGVTIINDYGKDWNKVKVLTQEFKFTSPASSTSAFKWTAGTYFFHQDNPAKQTTHFGEDAPLLGVPDKNFSITNTTKANSTGLALFGQITYTLANKLELIAGFRTDYEKKKYSVRGEYQKEPDPAFQTRPDTSAIVDYNAVSPRLGLSFQVYEKGQAYLMYNRGYRTGGLTQLSTDPSQPPLFGYQPEYSNSWEAGIKNSLWKNTLRINVALFYSTINNAQVPTLVLPDAITVTKNTGKLNSKGVEIEFALAMVENLQVDFNAGFTDTEFRSLKVSQNGTEVDLSGKRQIFTPASTQLLAAQYALPLSVKKNFRLVLRGELFAIGKQYFDFANTIEQSAYALVNLRIGFTSKQFELFLWSRNTGNKKYISYAYDFGAVHLGDPRTYGLTLGATF